MKALYEVKFTESHNKTPADGGAESMRVVAENVEEAITRVRKKQVGLTWDNGEKGKAKRTYSVTSIAVQGVTLVSPIDIL